MKSEKEVIFTDDYFGELSKEELEIHLKFLSKILFNLEGFDVWEAENMFASTRKWDEEAIERYESLLKEKDLWEWALFDLGILHEEKYGGN